MSTFSDISTQLTARGFAGDEITADVLAAITESGFELQPLGGGTPVAMLTELDTEIYRIKQTRGQYIIKVTLPDTSIVWLREVGTAPDRLVTVTDFAKRLSGRGFSGTEIVADVLGAIADAGYEMFAIGTIATVEIAGQVDTERFRIKTTRGQHALKLTMPDSTEIWLLEQAMADGTVALTAFKGSVASKFGM